MIGSFPHFVSYSIHIFAIVLKITIQMNKDFFTSLSKAGVLKVEITAEDLQKVMKDVARETANSLLAKMEEERSPKFIPRKEAMVFLNVTTALTMIRWEEKGYLNPHRIGGRIFYRQDDIVAAFEKFCRKEAFYA